MIRAIVFTTLLGVFLSARTSGEMMKGDDSPTGHVKGKFVKILEIMAWPMLLVAFLISSGL